MHRIPPDNDGLEIRVEGPLSLHRDEPRLLMWVLKAGQMVLGSVQISCEHAQVAQIRNLQLSSQSKRNSQLYSAKLMAAVAEYAREHGLLKLKVHRDSRCEWLPQQLSKFGFSDAARNGDDMQFYLDLYKPLLKRQRAPDRVHAPRSEASVHLAC